MADLWYYSHDRQKIGPCSGRQLKDLADCGSILPTDTVWKEGVERGVSASKVKNLFRPAPVPTPVEVPAVEAPAASLPSAPAQVEPAPPAAEPEALAPPAPPAPAPVAAGASSWQEPARKGRATAGKGAVIVTQDGVTVKFRKKCSTCGHLDTSWNTLPIRSGIMRAGFYCIKCRKHRDVEVHGSLS